MGVFGWIAIAVVTLVVGWFAVQALVGLAVPLRVSGTLLLKQELRKCRVQVDGLPKEFFDDCVSWAAGVSQVASLGSRAAFSRQAEFVKAIESLAQMVALWICEPDSVMFKLRGEPPKNGYRALFQKYDLKALQ
jgi:hypothetical protein